MFALECTSLSYKSATSFLHWRCVSWSCKCPDNAQITHNLAQNWIMTVVLMSWSGLGHACRVSRIGRPVRESAALGKAAGFRQGLCLQTKLREMKCVCKCEETVFGHCSPNALINTAWHSPLSSLQQPTSQPGDGTALPTPWSVRLHPYTHKHAATRFAVIPSMSPISRFHFLKPTTFPGHSSHLLISGNCAQSSSLFG